MVLTMKIPQEIHKSLIINNIAKILKTGNALLIGITKKVLSTSSASLTFTALKVGK